MIGLLAPVITTTVKTLCMSMLSEKLLIECTFILLKSLTKSTKNDLDDKILQEFEKVYRSK